MEKREQVIKGLECCSVDDIWSECENCPYCDRIEDGEDSDGKVIECRREEMMRDALEIIQNMLAKQAI